MLRDEVERLTEEDSRKKEQMKEMYETFSSEKSELKKCLENVSAHKQSVITLVTCLNFWGQCLFK